MKNEIMLEEVLNEIFVQTNQHKILIPFTLVLVTKALCFSYYHLDYIAFFEYSQFWLDLFSFFLICWIFQCSAHFLLHTLVKQIFQFFSQKNSQKISFYSIVLFVIVPLGSWINVDISNDFCYPDTNREWKIKRENEHAMDFSAAGMLEFVFKMQIYQQRASTAETVMRINFLNVKTNFSCCVEVDAGSKLKVFVTLLRYIYIYMDFGKVGNTAEHFRIHKLTTVFLCKEFFFHVQCVLMMNFSICFQ